MSPRLSVLSVLLSLVLVANASAMSLGKVKLVSHATGGSLTGGPGGGGGTSSNFGENFDQALSADGRYVTFVSGAHNLQSAVSDDGSSDRLYREDTVTGAIQMVDVNAAGTANATGLPTADQGFPNQPTASADGRYVVWHSGAKDLVSPFHDGAATDATASDVYVRDMQTGVTSLVSRSTTGPTDGGNGDSTSPVVTPDGRFVLFYSTAHDLASGSVSDSNGGYDLYRRDLQTATTDLVTVGPSGTAAATPAGVDYYAITPNGRYVVFTFQGNVSSLILGDSGSGMNVYRRDMTTGTTELLSPTSASATAGSGSVDASIPPLVSDDGRYVVFSSTASTLVSGDANGAEDVFLRDATSHTTTLVSHKVAASGSAAGTSTFPRITPDGRYVSFLSNATDLVSLANGPGYDAFRYDVQSGTNAVVSVTADGTATSGGLDANTYPVMSDDGRYFAFRSTADTLVTGFADNNSSGSDIYKRDMTTGITSLVSSSPGSSTDSGTIGALDPWITGDGRFVTFASNASNLVSPGTATAFTNLFERGNFLPRGLSIAATQSADPLAFGFTGGATDPDGTISSFGWLFGDGASGSGASTSHTYASAGAQTVTLTATDDEGESSSSTASVTPTAPTPTGGGGDQTGGGGGGQQGGGTAPSPFAFRGGLKVGSNGSVTAHVICPGAGTLTGALTLLGKGRAAAKKKATVLGLARLSVSKLGDVKLVVRLNKVGKALLKRKRKLKAKLTISFRPAAGGKAQAKVRTVTLRSPKKKH